MLDHWIGTDETWHANKHINIKTIIATFMFLILSTIDESLNCVLSHEVALEVDTQCKGGRKEGPLFVWFSKFIY